MRSFSDIGLVSFGVGFTITTSQQNKRAQLVLTQLAYDSNKLLKR